MDGTPTRKTKTLFKKPNRSCIYSIIYQLYKHYPNEYMEEVFKRRDVNCAGKQQTAPSNR